MIGRGEWRVKDIYKHLESIKEYYYRMTPHKKKDKAEETMFTCEIRDEAKTPQPPNTSERSSIHLPREDPREDAGGLSREYVLRIPSVS